MIESVWNQRVRRRDAVLCAAIDGGRRRTVFRRIELTLLFDRALHQRVFVHAKSFDPGHWASRFNGESWRGGFCPPPGLPPAFGAGFCAPVSPGGFLLVRRGRLGIACSLAPCLLFVSFG